MARITINGGTYETFDDKNMIGTKHIDYIYRYSGKIPDYVTSIRRLAYCEYTTIPNSVTSIEELDCCKNIAIPNSVTSIGRLRYCENITIPNSVTNLRSLYMHDCRNMKIIFYKGIKALGTISGLDNITIPDSVTSIGKLDNCSNITIPDSVTSIGEISNCSNIAISNSVTSIKGIYTSTLTIPASVTTINEISGENGCLMLMMESKTPPTLAKAVYLAKDDTLTVPVGAAEAYKNHPMWGKFKNISERNISASTNTKKAKPKPAEKVEEKKKGFFARLFGL